ncbi:hypothetical protein [Candidatus Albibeggiatoa sp. nov. NOAA]|uniref:hypothetical protein n=1 Tax=Candidatus Albibeggiatoa sp. nov. NOAA TaxID=3162724 RepID=UPI0032F1FB07|nr:hypothetical protein [Thiotrichaceae bacterium]
MKLAYIAKLLFYSVLLAIQCTFFTVQAADITPVTLPKDLPVSQSNPYVLDLDRAVATPNGNFLTQDHIFRFTAGVTTNATETPFVRITFTNEVLWNFDNAVLLFEEGNQPNLSGGTQDLNGDGRLELLEVGSLVEITPNQNVLIFSLGAPPTNTNASFILSTANPDYTVENGRITNTAAHPILSVVDTSKPARVTYSVHNTVSEARDGANAIFTDSDILLINFVPQFDFAITQPSTSVLDATANPPNSLFINEEGAQDALTSTSDTDATLSTASYLLVNNASLIDDPINLVPNDTLVINVFGNMTTISDVFIEFDDSGLTAAGTRSSLTQSTGQATTQFTGDVFPTTTRQDYIGIEIPGGQAIIPNSYSVNARLLLASNANNAIMDRTVNSAFNLLEQQLPIFSSQPIPNSNVEMISEFATPTSTQITFTNQGALPLDIQLTSQPAGEFEFATSYSTQLVSGQSDNFVIQCTPSSIAGTQLNLQFATNSPNQESINYNLRCRTQAIPEPEIEVTVDGVLIESGQNEINFGTIVQGESSVVKMTIRNIGNSTLTLDNPTIPSGFSLGLGQTIPKALPSIVEDEQNYTASFDLILTGNVLGEFKPLFSLSNNDRDENPYLITLSGKVVKPEAEPPTTDPNEPTVIPSTADTSTIPPGSTVMGAVNNGGGIAQDITIDPNGSVSGGYLVGGIDNQGLIANLTINPDTTVEGGRLSSVVYNFGTVCNATVTNYSELIGGNVCDDIQNFGTLTDVSLLEDAQVTGGFLSSIIFSQGTICDVELDDDTSVIGGRIDCVLVGQSRAPATIAQAEILQGSQLFNVCITPSVTFERGVDLRGNIQLPKNYQYPDMPDYCILPERISEYDQHDLLGVDPEAFSIFLDEDLELIPANAMKVLTPDQMSFIPDNTLDAITADQFDAIPLSSFSGLTENNMAGLTGYVIGHVTPEHIDAMADEAIANLNAWGTTKYITNFDPEIVPLEVAETFLKPSWSMDENGLLTVPADTPINFTSFNLPETFPKQVTIDYDFPDFSKGFGIGGRGVPILDEINAALNSTNNTQGIRSVRQREDGLIVMTDVDGLQRAFIPDIDGQIQLDADAPTGVVFDEATGKLLLTSTAQQQFSFIPAPKDYFLLSDTLGEDNAARCYKKGDVLLEIEVNGLSTYVVVTFGANVSRDTGDAGVYLPDDNAPIVRRNVRAPIREGRVVFSDGTSQNIYPAVLFPDTFISLANQVEGVDNVILNVDGTLSLTFFGLSYALLPTFDTTTRGLDPGERIPPSLAANPDGSIAYQVQDGDLLVTMNLVVSLL